MIEQSFGQRLLSFLKSKKILIGLLVVFLIVISSLFLILRPSKTSPLKSSEFTKSWEIIVAYDTKTQKLTLKNIKVIDKLISQDFRSAQFSPYELFVYSGDSALYRTKVNITEELLFMIENSPVASGTAAPSQPSSLDTNLYIPYFGNASRIVIKKNSEPVLEIPIKGSKSSFNFSFIKEASAQTCSPLQVVFLSDNYQDFNQFHQDAETLKNAFLATPPYSQATNIFDFQMLDNNQDLGCNSQGIINCISNPNILPIVNSKFPNASKVIVLVNQPQASSVNGSVAGVASGVGGNIAIFPVKLGSVSEETKIVAKHEVLGHLIGLLYDRYVMASPGYGLIKNGVRSNCTDNSQGESFWSQAGSTGVFQGCSNQAYFAPKEHNCPSQNPLLINGGNRGSIMSALGCASSVFDSIDQYWIENNVLPLYENCTTPGGASPGVTSGPVKSNIKGTIFIDANGNRTPDSGEGFSGAAIKLEGNYSETKTSADDGTYSFVDVPSGTYTLSAIAGEFTFVSSKSFTVTDGTNMEGMNFIIAQEAVITVTPGQGSDPGGTDPSSGGSDPGGNKNSKKGDYIKASCILKQNCSSTQAVQICTLECTQIE